MDTDFVKKHISIVGVALSFLVLTACGGGGSSSGSGSSSPELGSNEQINEAQATLDAAAAVSPFDYAAVDAARTACLVDGDVIDTNAEISCYQAFLETVAPLEAPAV